MLPRRQAFPCFPWDMRTKWSLYLRALSALTLVRLTADLAASLKPIATHRRWIPLTAGAAAVALAVATVVHAAGFRRVHGAGRTAALAYLRQQPLPSDRAAVEAHRYPVLRYLYDYGLFAGDPTYPSAFRIPRERAATPLDPLPGLPRYRGRRASGAPEARAGRRRGVAA
jgi:hypothetical protein